MLNSNMHLLLSQYNESTRFRKTQTIHGTIAIEQTPKPFDSNLIVVGKDVQISWNFPCDISVIFSSYGE